MLRKAALAFCLMLCCSPITAAVPAEAQQARKVYRIAVLANIPPTTPETVAVWDAFQSTLQEHGYIEGKNIAFDRRFAEGRTENFAALAADLARRKPDLIVV